MWFTAVATKEYHTSSSVPVGLHEGAVSKEGAAPTVVPDVLVEQVFEVEGVSEKAPAQSSFAGALMMQMLKLENVAAVAVVVNTRT